MNKTRSSNFELFRIITMLVIVAHHYVVNSGLMQLIRDNVANIYIHDLFLILFGWGGKTGINCFVLITGYFMCTSNISLRKFVKLVYQILFYNVLIYLIFVATGYEQFSIKEAIKVLLPVRSLKNDFTSCFLVFYLFIPFLNRMVHALTEREHLLLIVLCLSAFTLLPTLGREVTMNYVVWFCVLYVIASYIRLHSKPWMENKRICGWMALASLLLSWASCAVIALAGKRAYFFFVADSNKILAVSTAVLAFLFFRNLKIPQSKFINTVSASSFGVLLIHANSDTMRQWLWKDTLQNTVYYYSPYLFLHAITSVAVIYVICTIIDQVRIRTVEKWFFRWYDSRFPAKTRVSN